MTQLMGANSDRRTILLDIAEAFEDRDLILLRADQSQNVTDPDQFDGTTIDRVTRVSQAALMAKKGIGVLEPDFLVHMRKAARQHLEDSGLNVGERVVGARTAFRGDRSSYVVPVNPVPDRFLCRRCRKHDLRNFLSAESPVLAQILK